MELMDMTLGEFYEKAEKAVAELEGMENLSLETFNETTKADLKDAGLLEDPIFLRDGTIYFGIKNLYPDAEVEEEDNDETQKKFDIEQELGTIHAAYKKEFRGNEKTIPLQAEITQKADYPMDASLSDLERQIRLDAANSEKERMENEIKEMQDKISDYKEKVSVLKEVIANNGLQ